MKDLGKWVTAGGGVIVAVFSLIGLILVASFETYGQGGGAKANGIFQGIIIMILGGAVAVGAVLMYDKLAKVLGLVAIAATAAAMTPSRLADFGGMNVYIVLDGVIAVLGAFWSQCGGDAVADLAGGASSAPASGQAAPSAPKPGENPPESRL
ncbi:MAG: hypothetical protein BIFFINMI_04325 [Phycisphaerae bacterium]|nr:hypothetical protein [Phycisphaerae bacterium]